MEQWCAPAVEKCNSITVLAHDIVIITRQIVLATEASRIAETQERVVCMCIIGVPYCMLAEACFEALPKLWVVVQCQHIIRIASIPDYSIAEMSIADVILHFAVSALKQCLFC